jgi:hypothetical protein
MTDFIQSFATQQLLPPWEAEEVQSWGFVVPMTETCIQAYLDAYFNGAYPDPAPYYYTAVPGALYGLVAAAVFGRVASLNENTASRLEKEAGEHDHDDTHEAWDHLRHNQVNLTFPALRYPRSKDNLIIGDPILVWIEPFIFSDNDSVVFASREIWGSDCYLGSIVRASGGPGAGSLHLDLGMIGIKTFNPRSMSELISVLHIKTDGADRTQTVAGVLKAKPELAKFISILAGSGAFAGAPPEGIDPPPYKGGTELNNLKQFRDCYDMGAAIYRAIVASTTTHFDVKYIALFDAAKVELAFMWSDSVGPLLTALFDAKIANDGTPLDHKLQAEKGPDTPTQATWAGPPDDFKPPPPLTPNEMDWDMLSLTLPVQFAFSFNSKARFDVTETLHTYGQAPPPAEAT